VMTVTTEGRFTAVRTENLIRVDKVSESPKLSIASISWSE